MPHAPLTYTHLHTHNRKEEMKVLNTTCMHTHPLFSRHFWGSGQSSLISNILSLSHIEYSLGNYTWKLNRKNFLEDGANTVLRGKVEVHFVWSRERATKAFWFRMSELIKHLTNKKWRKITSWRSKHHWIEPPQHSAEATRTVWLRKKTKGAPWHWCLQHPHGSTAEP